jgi:hypothetical protein
MIGTTVMTQMQIRHKNTKNTNELFSTISQKAGNGNICILSHNSWFNQGSDLLSTSKWPSEPHFCEIYSWSWPKKWPEMVVKQPFIILFCFRTVYKSLHHANFTYRKDASSRPVYYSILNSFGQRSTYISIKLPLPKLSKSPKVCY